MLRVQDVIFMKKTLYNIFGVKSHTKISNFLDIMLKHCLPLTLKCFIFKRETTVINSNCFFNRSKIIQNAQSLSPQVAYAQVS